MDDQTGAGPESVVQILLKALDSAGVQASDAIVAIPDGLLISRVIEVEPGLNEVELELHVRLEAEQYVPYALDDMALDFEVQGRSASHPGRVDVLMVACRHEVLEWYRSVLAGAGLTPRVVAVQAHGLASGVEAMTAGMVLNGAVAVLELGAHASLLSVVRQGQAICVRELLFGQAGVDEQAFKTNVARHLEHGLEVFAASGVAGPIGMLVLAGEGAATPGLSQWLEARFGMPTHIANPFLATHLDPALAPEALLCDAPALLTACGLAMRGFD